MNNLQINLACTEDLAILIGLYADMNDKPLMPKSEITNIWQQIQQVPDYFLFSLFRE